MERFYQFLNSNLDIVGDDATRAEWCIYQFLFQISYPTMATTTFYKHLYIAMTMLTMTMAGTIPMDMITSDMDRWEGQIIR